MEMTCANAGGMEGGLRYSILLQTGMPVTPAAHSPFVRTLIVVTNRCSDAIATFLTLSKVLEERLAIVLTFRLRFCGGTFSRFENIQEQFRRILTIGDFGGVPDSIANV